MKTIIKASEDQIGGHDVFQNGEKVATLWFCRDRRDVQSRVTVSCTGEFKNLRSGRALRLDHYSWFADVRKDVVALLEATKGW